MQDKNKTKMQLIKELERLRQRVTELEASEAQRTYGQVTTNRIAILVRDSNDAITMQDFDGNISAWNSSAEKMYGFSEAEALKMNVAQLHPDDKRAEALAFVEKIRQGETLISFETRRVTKDGRILDIWLTATALVDNRGRPIAVATTERDITERKQTEERAQLHQRQLLQADKMASLGVLVSGVAHEINNPNYCITLNAKLISRFWNDAMPILKKYYEENGDYTLAGMPYTRGHTKIMPLIDGISDGAKRIQKIVQSLKNFARQDSGSLDEMIHINSLVESVTAILGNLIKRSTHQFSVQRGENLPTIQGNFQQLEQVLINLITNACQSLKNKENHVHVRTSYDEAENRIVITVVDDGEGISPENLSYIMDPFFTTKQHIGGTGLGLSVSYGIIKAHGGDVHFDSELGKGTTATVTFPVHRQEPQQNGD
jgi:PAS domain S-box-containing protein